MSRGHEQMKTTNKSSNNSFDEPECICFVENMFNLIQLNTIEKIDE